MRGVEKVRRIRSEIAIDALVKAMPPVEIADEIWVLPDRSGAINGRAGVVRLGQDTWFGVHLPAPTALCSDRDLLRAILVHEFAHCFFQVKAAIDAADAGSDSANLPRTTDVFSDRAHEDALLVDPHEWFSKADADAFVTWDDSRFDGSGGAALEKALLSLADYLPVLTPPMKYKVERLAYPKEVADHVRRLRVRQ